MASVGQYIKESFDELIHKVTWPTRKELQSNAILVFVASLIIALLVFVMDYVFGVRSVDDSITTFQWRGVLGYLYDMLTA